MKALSLWQPWATLIAIGAKPFETRHWSTSYRGPLLICAAKRPLDRDTREVMKYDPDFTTALRDIELPFGKAVCLVNLTGCIPTEKIPYCINGMAFGDFSEGRFAWKLENIKRVRDPFTLIGHQGLFNVPSEVVANELQPSSFAESL